MRSESWRGNCRKDAWESYIQLSGGSIWLWCSCLNPGNPRSLGGRGGFLETSSGRPPGGTHSLHSPGIQCLVLGVKSAVDERETWRWHEKTKIVRFYFWHERTDAVFTKFHLCGISGTGYFIETESRLGVGDQGLGEGVMGSLCFMRTELLFGGGDKLRKQMLVTWLTVVCIVNAAELHTKNFSNGRLLTKIFIEWKKKTKTLQWGLLHSEALFQGIRPSGSWGGWASVSFPFQEDKSSLPFRRRSTDPGSHPAIYCCQAKGRQAKGIIQVPDWVWLWLAYVVSKDPACYAQQTEYGNSLFLTSGFQK